MKDINEQAKSNVRRDVYMKLFHMFSNISLLRTDCFNLNVDSRIMRSVSNDLPAKLPPITFGNGVFFDHDEYFDLEEDKMFAGDPGYNYEPLWENYMHSVATSDDYDGVFTEYITDVYLAIKDNYNPDGLDYGEHFQIFFNWEHLRTIFNHSDILDKTL